MVTVDQLVRIFLLSAVIIIVPGPSVLFLVGRALSAGTRVALWSIVGNTLGCTVGAVLVAIGLAPVIRSSPTVLWWIKVLGALYLVWLGVQAWRTASAHLDPDPERHTRTESTATAVRRGFIVGITNPKALIIYAALLPQAVDVSRGSVTQQMLVLALVPLIFGALSDSVWALLAGQARAWFAHSPGRLVMLERIGGACLIALGTLLALTAHLG